MIVETKLPGAFPCQPVAPFLGSDTICTWLCAVSWICDWDDGGIVETDALAERHRIIRSL